MLFFADFHIHSQYSYATSKSMDLQALATWGQLKGLTLMGTGDFTHPKWQHELSMMLEPSEQGLFALLPKYKADVDKNVYSSCKGMQRFLLTAEIATVFRRNGACYKIHSIIFAPSLYVVQKISDRLSRIGNISYDGRPVLRLDVKDLVKIILDISPDCMLIPAHIWTPYFGLLGAKSGFDSFLDCFQEQIDHIYAFEKGLSSSFLMNAMVSDLDRFAILSNSDAHSVQNLGREANIFNTDLSYDSITQALKSNDPASLLAGIEFFPEMGKYYATGHRNCGIYIDRGQLVENYICSSCEKPLTLGVMHRVSQLADRTLEKAALSNRRCYAIVPLQKIIACNLGFQETSKKVQQLYHRMLEALGNEFYILLNAQLDEIAKYSNSGIAQAIHSIRTGAVVLQPGYDGVYGKISFDR
jgi:uncharacterized protein (TIGR00375 family)